MSLYQLSYDVDSSEENSTEAALVALIAFLVKNLGSTRVRRPVRTTIVFDTAKGYFEVLNLIAEWAKASNAYYTLSQILPHEDGKRFYYMMKVNADLQTTVDEYVKAVRPS